jgi:hypothetical protein
VRVWGKAANGKRFSYSYVEGRTRHTRLQPLQTVASCTVYISDIDGYKGGPFSWNTSQTCSGAFGEQKQETQIWRTSYRGWLGYGAIATTKLTASSYEDYYWELDCNSGAGTYNYEAEMQGFATNIGWSGWVGSDNTPRDDCGPNPP